MEISQQLAINGMGVLGYRLFGKPSVFAVVLLIVISAGSVVALAADPPPAPSSQGQRSSAVQLNKDSSLPPQSQTCPMYPASAGVSLTEPPAYLLQRKKRDRSCLVSAEAAIPQHGLGKITLVDVRAPESFDRYSVPGSLNVPLHAIKAKTFLKATSVVMLDEGHTTAGLETACAELKREGFTRVAVLNGGLRAWRDRHGPLTGDALAQKELERLTPQELFIERSYDDWLVLDFSPNRQSASRKWLPQSVETVRAKGDAAIVAIKSAVAKKRKSVPSARVLVVSDTGADYENIARLVGKAGVNDVLYLESGLSGYKDFLSKQVAMWNQQNQPLRFPACRG